MGKAQKKTGKGRLDKYYKLAKEQGYRARSAFKLIQLNKKYSILENSRCTIDLCAAPGGWLQVASKFMPANSVIIGVDLVPIKPIPRVVTFTADITGPQCRNLIRNEIKDWKADVVLHDGAPNVGTAWIQDAYSQSELVLMSLKLAVEFLANGGTFVTKVFRSVDYNNLMWVFSQLFGKVEATKPPSSRNVSAEIFVVCRDFLAPKHIDPKFLDPKYVFKDLSSSTAAETRATSAGKAQSNVFHPEKKRRHRDGYADGDYTLFTALPASQFIYGHDPVLELGTANQITFSTDEERTWASLSITTAEVKENCSDLKVLGKGDFKLLIKWRLALRQELGLDVVEKEAKDTTNEDDEIVEVVDEEEQISSELARLSAEASARAKRERRRANEIKTKVIQRMQLQMTAPLDIGMEHSDPSLLNGQEETFDLGIATSPRTRRGLLHLADTGDDVFDDDEESHIERHGDEQEVPDSDIEPDNRIIDLEAELDDLYDAYRQRVQARDAKARVKETRQKNALRDEKWHGIQEDDPETDSGTESGGWDKIQEAKLGDEEASDESDSDSSTEHPVTAQPIQHNKRRLLVEESDVARKRQRINATNSNSATRTAAKLWFSNNIFNSAPSLEHGIDRDEDDMALEDEQDNGEKLGLETDDFEMVPIEEEDDKWDGGADDQNEEIMAKTQMYGLTTPEAVTLAQQLVNRQRTKSQLIDDGFTRYSLNSKEGLPSWFIEDERQNYKPNIPITKEAMAALRAKQRALDARPIKKIAEAKARKKYKAAQRLEKAMKKADGVNSNADMSEREKAQAIEKLMKKGTSATKKKDIKLVVAKGAHKGIKGRPKGVKGRYTMVDARMKKEVRAKKRKEKATSKRR